MSQPRRYPGQPASEGWAAGVLYQADSPAGGTTATAGQVEAAFAAVAADRAALAARLRADGRDHEAEIVGVAALIAADPVLVAGAVTAVRAGTGPAEAIRQTAETQAATLAAIPDPLLAERAGDVRQVAAAVLERLAGGPQSRPDEEFILVRRDVAAADLIEQAEHGLAGAVSVAGGASSHAAIIARGLGIPMITGVDAAALAEPAGCRAELDADAGQLTVGTAAHAAGSRRSTKAPEPARESARLDGQARTADGQSVTVLCNVASAAETRTGLAEGAAGVGLLRTEIGFTGRPDWPSEADHLAQLTPILELLAGRLATVRLLDFSGDKIPPFLRGGALGAGLAALLDHPAALDRQLRAALTAGRATDLALLIPMVSETGQIDRVRAALRAAAGQAGLACPRTGIMVELAATAADAARFAAQADFFSIGTNDLTGQVLGLDRLSQGARPGLAADPRVLELVANVVTAAGQAGIGLSVCGDAAADPVVLPLLIGLGVRTVSVPAARVALVGAAVAKLDAGACAELAAKATGASSLAEVEELVGHALAR
ncbi:MAG TPA: putative PEP-binding protein [Streptosporangiaceae bacterium]